MPESARLQALRQQRALLLEQLALLEKQIALEAELPPAAPATTAKEAAASILANAAVTRPKVATKAEAEADALLSQLVASEGNPGAFSKSGCWLIFSVAMLAALGLVGVVYYFFYR
jgi:hypothetical protein